MIKTDPKLSKNEEFVNYDLKIGYSLGGGGKINKKKKN